MKKFRFFTILFIVGLCLLTLGYQVIGQDSDTSRTITIPMSQILNNDPAAIELLIRNGVPSQLISEIQTNYTSQSAEQRDHMGPDSIQGVQSDKYVVCPGYEWGNATILHGGFTTGFWKFSDNFSLGMTPVLCTDTLGCLTFHQARRGPGISPTRHNVVADWVSLHSAWCS